MKVYQQLARACGAYHRCVKSNNQEWITKWKEQIDQFLDSFPHGSGFDNGTKIDLDRSGDDLLIFTTSFHHMDGNGFYDGWTDHTVTIKPSLSLGFHIAIGGRDRNSIKEYITECFSTCLSEDVAIVA